MQSELAAQRVSALAFLKALENQMQAHTRPAENRLWSGHFVPPFPHWGRVNASGELGGACQVLSPPGFVLFPPLSPAHGVTLAFPTLGPRTPTPEQNMLSPHADSPDLQTNSPLPPQLFELPKAKTVPTTTEK